MKKYYHLDSGAEYQGQPIDGMYNPASDHAYMVSKGWRYGELPDITAGFTRVVSGAHQDPDRSDWCVLDYMDYSQEAMAEQARLAKLATITPELMQQAAVFRLTLRRHFGDNAETNTNVTQSAVAGYFTQKQVAQTITAAELADAVILNELFAAISAWTGDGTTWSFPYELLP